MYHRGYRASVSGLTTRDDTDTQSIVPLPLLYPWFLFRSFRTRWSDPSGHVGERPEGRM